MLGGAFPERPSPRPVFHCYLCDILPPCFLPRQHASLVAVLYNPSLDLFLPSFPSGVPDGAQASPRPSQVNLCQLDDDDDGDGIGTLRRNPLPPPCCILIAPTHVLCLDFVFTCLVLCRLTSVARCVCRVSLCIAKSSGSAPEGRGCGGERGEGRGGGARGEGGTGPRVRDSC